MFGALHSTSSTHDPSLEAVGVNDVLSKSQGSSNPHNVVKATFDALLRLKNAHTIAKNRGITLEKLYKG